MNFHGYQQPEILTQQVMHTNTIQEEKNIMKNFRLPFVVLTTIPKTMNNLEIYRGKMCSDMKEVRRESIGRPLENFLICDGILCHVMDLWQVDRIWSLRRPGGLFFEEGAKSCMCGVNPWFLG